jgi:hypothetical protein
MSNNKYINNNIYINNKLTNFNIIIIRNINLKLINKVKV